MPTIASLPTRLSELEGKSVALAGDALLSAAYIAYTFAIARALKIKVMINKFDFMHLQGINGGNLPDEMGVASIDVDCDYQNETVSENDAILRPQLSLDTPFLSPTGNLTMLYEMLDRQAIELYEFYGQYTDGISFLQTGDPDVADPRPAAFEAIYGWNSIIADLLKGEGEHKYWEMELKKIRLDSSYVVRDFLATQIYTRVGSIGRCARTKEPLITNNPWTISWLSKSGLYKAAGPPTEQRHNILIDALTTKDSIKVGHVLDFIENSISQRSIRDAIEKDEELRARLEHEAKENWLLCIINLLLGLVPGLGQLTTLVSHLYQRRRVSKTKG